MAIADHGQRSASAQETGQPRAVAESLVKDGQLEGDPYDKQEQQRLAQASGMLLQEHARAQNPSDTSQPLAQPSWPTHSAHDVTAFPASYPPQLMQPDWTPNLSFLNYTMPGVLQPPTTKAEAVAADGLSSLSHPTFASAIPAAMPSLECQYIRQAEFPSFRHDVAHRVAPSKLPSFSGNNAAQSDALAQAPAPSHAPQLMEHSMSPVSPELVTTSVSDRWSPLLHCSLWI